MDDLTVEEKKILVQTAKKMLAGDISLVQGCHVIAPYLMGHPLQFDGDLVIFTSVDCETDHLPQDETREHWDPQALIKKDEKLKHTEEFYRDRLLKGCRAIISRFDRDENL